MVPSRMAETTERRRDALLVIRRLRARGEQVTIQRVADAMGITKPSAQELMAKLRAEKLLKGPTVRVIGEWELTADGEKTAAGS